jgi:hypothetical protein
VRVHEKFPTFADADAALIKMPALTECATGLAYVGFPMKTIVYNFFSSNAPISARLEITVWQ